MNSDGLTIGLQLIGSSNEDEKLLAVMKLIEQEMKIKVKAARLSEESVGHFMIKDPRATAMLMPQSQPLEMTHYSAVNNDEEIDEEKASLVKRKTE